MTSSNIKLVMVTDWSEERTVEEDEEQLVMRRLRNSVDDLRRGLRHLTYKVRLQHSSLAQISPPGL